MGLADKLLEYQTDFVLTIGDEPIKGYRANKIYKLTTTALDLFLRANKLVGAVAKENRKGVMVYDCQDRSGASYTLEGAAETLTQMLKDQNPSNFKGR